jgi:hypothetical protein
LHEGDVALTSQHEVDENCVRTDLLRSSQSFIPIFNENYLVAVVLQSLAIGLLRISVVVDEKGGCDAGGVQEFDLPILLS